MRTALVLGSGLLAALAPAQASRHTLAEQYLFQSVNAEREANGLRPLRWNLPLQDAANGHANWMRATATLSHQLRGEPDLTERAARSGASFSLVAENVAVGDSVVQMHSALMHSPHHRENILDPEVDSIAVAVVVANGRLWAVEDFAHTVEALSFDEQENRVAALLESRAIPAQPTLWAEETCRKDSGYVGDRPGFVMRYTTGDLNLLPQQLLARLQAGGYRTAAVGACPANSRGFASYSVAILLYR